MLNFLFGSICAAETCSHRSAPHFGNRSYELCLDKDGPRTVYEVAARYPTIVVYVDEPLCISHLIEAYNKQVKEEKQFEWPLCDYCGEEPAKFYRNSTPSLWGVLYSPISVRGKPLGEPLCAAHQILYKERMNYLIQNIRGRSTSYLWENMFAQAVTYARVRLEVEDAQNLVSLQAQRKYRAERKQLLSDIKCAEGKLKNEI